MVYFDSISMLPLYFLFCENVLTGLGMTQYFLTFYSAILNYRLTLLYKKLIYANSAVNIFCKTLHFQYNSSNWINNRCSRHIKVKDNVSVNIIQATGKILTLPWILHNIWLINIWLGLTTSLTPLAPSTKRTLKCLALIENSPVSDFITLSVSSHLNWAINVDSMRKKTPV
jgi:hypothetical protein